MDVAYPPEAETYREKVQAFLAEHLPAGWQGIGALGHDEAAAFTEDWRTILFENGYLAVSWPKEYGGQALSSLEQVVLAEEFARAGVPAGGPNDVFGIQMVGNTIIQWGTEEQKRHFLPRILSGEDRWCQGYSEPNAGSDLGNLGCRATLDGDEWTINGQKIWTSAGHLANWIFVLTRTDPTAPKHKGITFLLVPMDQPGIEVRPIKMISGESEFNEVFFTDARTPKSNVIGEANGGWAVAMTLLGYERGEAAATLPIRFRTELDRLIELARERGRADDPIVRQRLADCFTKVELMRYLGMRALTAFLAGSQPGPEASISKVFWSEYHQQSTELAMDILGLDGLVPTGRPPAPRVPDRRPRRAQRQRLVGRRLPQREGGHHLRRNVADPAQHHRRDGARPAQGTTCRRRSVGSHRSGNIVRDALGPQLTARELYALLRLRSEVFVVEQDCVYADLDGRDLDPTTHHFWIDNGGDIIAAVRVLAGVDGSGSIARPSGHRIASPPARPRGHAHRRGPRRGPSPGSHPRPGPPDRVVRPIRVRRRRRRVRRGRHRAPADGADVVSGRWFGRAALAVLSRPGLWITALVQVLRLARPGWWRHWPPLPVPDAAYLRFRLQTQYGDIDREPDPADVVTYLHWCRGYGRAAR